jgi:hypothetical protein
LQWHNSLLLPAFLAFTAAVLPPNASIGQDAGFGRDADVHVREDSFACKETSELDRLLQRNQSGGFTSGVQLYEYLQSHNCIGLSAGRVRVHATHHLIYEDTALGVAAAAGYRKPWISFARQKFTGSGFDERSNYLQ